MATQKPASQSMPVALSDGTNSKGISKAEAAHLNHKRVFEADASRLHNHGVAAPHHSMHVYEVMSALSDVITFSGGSVMAITALREGKRLLEAMLTSRSRREITIRADGLSVQIKGSHDIDEAIRAFEKVAAEKKRHLKTARERRLSLGQKGDK
jgi:hypothetical protein